MKNFFASLIGKFTWQKPAWLSSILFSCQKNPRKTRYILIGSLLIVILGAAGYGFYQTLPKPQLLSAHLYIPNIIVKDNKQLPQPLRIVFNNTIKNSVIYPGDNDSEVGIYDVISVAPLPEVGKILSHGVKITPAIPGQWQWQTDKTLVFMPDSPWPAGVNYTVHFDKSLFGHTGKTYRLSAWHADFTTIPFSITVKDFKFFQDIAHPDIYKTSATLSFNYPVDPNSLSSNIQLSYPISTRALSHQVSYSPGNWQAYIQAEITPLPDHAQYIALDINKNIKPLTPGNPTEKPLQARLMIPDKNSIMKIKHVHAIIVHNDKDQPEQIITLETAVGTTTAALEKSLHAYLLPIDYPATEDRPAQKNYPWHTPGEVNTDLLTQKVEMIPLSTAHDFETLHSFKIHVEPNRYVYIAIDKGLTSYNDYTLALPYAAIVRAPEYPKEIHFLHRGSLLTLSGEKRISVIIRGLPAVKFTIARVLPDEINHLITQTSGSFQNPQFIHYSFNASDISIIASEIEMFDDNDKSKAQYMALDLSKYLNTQPFKLGLFLLKAEGWDPVNKITTGIYNSRLILITDTDLLVKNNAQGTHDVFVQSITQGTPVAGAQVAVLGKNGLPLMTQITDAQGHTQFPSLKDFTDDKAPTAYVASKGNDISFMPYTRYDRSLNYSRFDTGGDTNIHKYGLNAFLFSDRGIYRPGEEIHLGMIVKGNYAAATIPDLPLELIITDPRGMTVYDKKLASNTTGLLTESYTPDTTALTGDYSAALYVTKDNIPDDLLGSTIVQVQDFEPDQLKMTARFDPAPVVAEGWVSPQNLSAHITLWNLFGTPASHRRVTGKLYFSPHPLQFSAYPETIFSDPYSDPAKPLKVFSETLSDIQTDDKGQAVFNLDLSRYAQSTYQLTLSTQGFAAEGGRGVSQTATVLVSPLSYLIGYKTDNNLTYIRQGDKPIVHFIAINAALKKMPVENLKIKILKLNSVTTLAKQADGSYQYQTVIQEHPISEVPFAISATGTDVVLPSPQIGDFKIQITDQQGLLLSQLAFSIIGQGEQAIAKNATMTLKLNKKAYAPGETIQLNITAPYTGAGLITIERDKVYAFKWFSMNSTSTLESITLPPDFEGTGYINVALVRDWHSDEIFMSPLSYNVQAFSVIPDARRLNINLQLPDRVYPGKPLAIEYTTDKPGNIIIYAVDEGILQVANYQTPDPIGYYFNKQALTVDTAQIADQILPQYIANRELSAIGGDGEQKSIASNLNPFARKVAPVVYWSGILSTGTKPQQVIYPIPDYFNGTLRVMAIAVSPQGVGSAMHKLQVKADYILTPNVPTFVAPHDQFEVSVSVANTSNLTSPVILQVKPSDNLEVQGVDQQSLDISPSTEKTAIFKIKAKDLLGTADLDFVATANHQTFRRKITLSPRPVTPYQTTLIGGYAVSDKNFSITRALYPEFRILEAVSSTNPFILLKGLRNYLAFYPYDCTEQLLSRAFVQLALKNQPGYSDNSGAFNNAYHKTLHMLRARQTSDGGFTYWPWQQNPTAHPFVTLYAADFLTTAKNDGEKVPAELFSRTLGYLKAYAGSNPVDIQDARLHAYAIYILTRNDILTTDYIANLQAYFQQTQNKTWQQDITGAYLAASYKMLQNSEMANKLIASYKLNRSAFSDNDDFYNLPIMDAQYITILANDFPDRLQKIKPSELMSLVNNLSGNMLNSLSAARSAQALSEFAKALPAETADNKLSISALDKNHQKQLLTSSVFNTDISKIYFHTQDHTGYFYQITQAGFDQTPSTQEIKSGLEVYREYQDTQGMPVTSVKLGDILEVHLSIRSLNHRVIDNIAMIDLLPGGFELVPNSIIAKNPDNSNYYNAREDRIVFYLTATPDLQEYTYRIRAINKGTFAIPPVFAQAMYHPQITAQHPGGMMVVQ